MAFRTNKVPAIEERTVSGSSVSFNSAFALPLKACKVSFSATESGSGTKSPSNPYTISGVSSLNLSANSVPMSVNFGDTYYGGYADLVRKKIILEWYHIIYNGTETWSDRGEVGTNHRFIRSLPYECIDFADSITNYLSYVISYQDFGTYRITNGNIIICDTSGYFNSETALRDYLSNNPLELVYKLGTPIEIDLSSIPDLSSIIGNNSFSTDTGTLEITFADLQEKSASGSVATFNTALAMPLSSCNIAVNAWQEGSGEPSPSNVRPIHGYDKTHIVNMSDVTNKAYFEGLLNGTYGFVELSTLRWSRNTNYAHPFYVGGGINSAVNTLNMINTKGYLRKASLSPLIGTDKAIQLSGADARIRDDDYETVTAFREAMEGQYLIYELETPTTPTITKAQFDMLLSAFGIEGELYTIQLGQEVYGAEVDAVNGVAHCTHGLFVFDGTENWSLRTSGTTIYQCNKPSDMAGINNDNYLTSISNMAKSKPRSSVQENEYYASASLFILNLGASTLQDHIDILSTQNLKVATPLAEPFDIQLTPTQIETLIGNNTIFADTGDIDLTYKDLDIAKRGNFREVFKLPS